MGFLSKLFGGDKAAEKAAKDLLNGLFGAQNTQAQPQTSSAPAPSVPAQDAWEGSSEEGSVWEQMPAEENQYNFGGHFTQYFEGIFAAELPGFRVEKSIIDGRRYIYTFFNGTVKALVVELMSDRCSAYKLRNDTKREGVPYLRFYYDHNGWWNTRSYVATRLHEAVK